jgi:hypothetical protein
MQTSFDVPLHGALSSTSGTMCFAIRRQPLLSMPIINKCIQSLRRACVELMLGVIRCPLAFVQFRSDLICHVFVNIRDQHVADDAKRPKCDRNVEDCAISTQVCVPICQCAGAFNIRRDSWDVGEVVLASRDGCHVAQNRSRWEASSKKGFWNICSDCCFQSVGQNNGIDPDVN